LPNFAPAAGAVSDTVGRAWAGAARTATAKASKARAGRAAGATVLKGALSGIVCCVETAIVMDLSPDGDRISRPGTASIEA